MLGGSASSSPSTPLSPSKRAAVNQYQQPNTNSNTSGDEDGTTNPDDEDIYKTLNGAPPSPLRRFYNNTRPERMMDKGLADGAQGTLNPHNPVITIAEAADGFDHHISHNPLLYQVLADVSILISTCTPTISEFDAFYT
jgi:hypothetical protein